MSKGRSPTDAFRSRSATTEPGSANGRAKKTVGWVFLDHAPAWAVDNVFLDDTTATPGEVARACPTRPEDQREQQTDDPERQIPYSTELQWQLLRWRFRVVAKNADGQTGAVSATTGVVPKAPAATTTPTTTATTTPTTPPTINRRPSIRIRRSIHRTACVCPYARLR